MKASEILYSARPDTFDFRDRIFRPSLVEVPTELALDTYRKWKVPILDQGKTWACTGFALATVVHYLMRTRKVHPEQTLVSHAMLFEMARRYDDYPGEYYLGSSARGAMKGWHQHGVCREVLWKFRARHDDRRLTADRAKDASGRPLGAYLRVNHRDLVAMHCALAEVGILYAVTQVHTGWLELFKRTGRTPASARIPHRGTTLGAHAIALVGYDENGFWVHNSFGEQWGYDGFGFIDYDDWLENGLDSWVARLAVPIVIEHPESAAAVSAGAPAFTRTAALQHLRPHIARIHNEGYLRSNDMFGTSAEDLKTLFYEHFPAATKTWRRKHLLLYAGAGLVSTATAVQRSVADYQTALPAVEVYPIAFIWRTEFWDQVSAVLRDALDHRRSPDKTEPQMDFMLDRLDDALEPLAREYAGKLHWDQVKQTALQATALRNGGVRLTLQHVAELVEADPTVEVHLVAHGAGAILLAPAVQLLTTRKGERVTVPPLKGRQGLGVPVQSCVLWAPACSFDLFDRTYLPAIDQRRIKRFTLFTLTDRAERADNCAQIYRKSLLYLISNAFEETMRVPGDPDRDGVPLVGMEKFLTRPDWPRPELVNLCRRRKSVRWVAAPNMESDPSVRSTARRHGDFDDDVPTLLSTLSCILDTPVTNARFGFRRSAQSTSAWRRTL